MRWKTFEEEARHLVALNQSEIKSIVRSYIFLDAGEEVLRVIHVDRNMLYEREITPYRFPPDPKERLFHPSEVALVSESQDRSLEPPNDWGSWEDCIVVERPERRRAV